MEDYDDLGSYNGDVEHDMWVDYDHFKNIGEPDVFDEEDIDDIVDDLNVLDNRYNLELKNINTQYVSILPSGKTLYKIR